MTAQTPVAYDPYRTPYEVSEAGFPAAGSAADRSVFLLRYAILAPSTFNTQPWKFAVRDGGVDVYADLMRRLPVVDPEGRELLLSIGAAIFNFRVAAARFGLHAAAHVYPEGFPDGCVTHLRLTPQRETEPGLQSLFPYMPLRHTNREPFLLSRIPAAVRSVLHALPPEGRAGLIVSMDGQLNTHVAELVAEADRALLSHQEYRTSIAEWTRPDWSQMADGIPASNLGVKVATGLAPWAAKVLDLSRIKAAIDRNLCIEAPGLVVITGEESPGAWIEAGQMLERLLLTLVREGLQFSYFNMPVQVPDLRLRLRALLAVDVWPQLVLRIGYCLTEPRATPRRPLEDVLLRHTPV